MIEINLLPEIKSSRHYSIRLKISLLIFLVSCLPILFLIHKPKSHLPMQPMHPIKLHSVSIYKLKFAGYLQQKGETTAIILLPNKEITFLAVGDYVGIEDARIIHINEKGISLRIANHMQEIKLC